MICEARQEDAKTLLEYCQRFYQESGYSGYVSFDAEQMHQVICDMIESPDKVIFIADNGMAGAVVTHTYFSSDPVAHELFWWIAEARRGSGLGRDLRASLEQWANEKNARCLIMSALDMSSDQHIRDGYRKLGYTPAETSFIRRL